MAEGDGFRWTVPNNKIVEIEINWKLYYTFDGATDPE